MGEGDRAQPRRHDAAAAEAREDPRRRAGVRLSEPRELVVERDGLRIAVLDWGGHGEPLLLLHPNGFCAGLFDPLARRLRDDYRPVGVDLRAHGGTDVPVGDPPDFSFATMALDVVAVLDELGIEQVDALGESLGGGVTLAVDAARPGRLRRLMLCEAIAFDTEKLGTRRGGGSGERRNFMADAARKRRQVWPDRATVRASYGSRPPLDALAPEALDAYVRWGFVDRPDGQVELACPSEAEATLFEMSSAPAVAWEQLASLSAPATILYGTSSDLPGEWFESQADRAGTTPIVVEGGHFFLQEDTARAEALVREHLPRR